MKLMHPISLHLIQSSFQALQESPVGDFGLIVGLRMPYLSEPLCNGKLLVELEKSCAVKLETIIHDNHFGKVISVDDGFPYKVLHLGIYDVG